MITVLAATGFTGQLIVQELIKRKADFRIAGRNKEKLQRLADELKLPAERSIVADAARAETFPQLLNGTRVLVNCAGPFTDLGIAVVRAAAEAGVHYLDTTGEQSFIKQVAEQCHPIAQSSGCALVPACAFEYAIGDAAAALAAREFSECDEVAVYYAVGGATTRGTKKSIITAMINPSYSFIDGAPVLQSAGAEQRDIEFPGIGQRRLVSFGGGEVFSLPRRIRARNVKTFINIGVDAMTLKFGRLLLVPLLKTPLRGIINRQIDKQPEGPTMAEREKSKFTIVSEAKAGARSKRITAAGSDPYGLTALIAAETAVRLVDADKDVSGYTSTAHAFGADLIVKLTEASGVKWQN